VQHRARTTSKKETTSDLLIHQESILLKVLNLEQTCNRDQLQVEPVKTRLNKLILNFEIKTYYIETFQPLLKS
jgi:hypothetical protein